MSTVFVLEAVFVYTQARETKVRYVPFNRVSAQDPFWRLRMQANREVTIPYNLKMCEETRVVENFRRAAGLSSGPMLGLLNWDNALCKSIEAASYRLISDYELDLDRYLDTLIGTIAAAQEDNRYLFALKTVALDRGQHPVDRPKTGSRWSDLKGSLELYTAGHMYEAAVSHYRATGKRGFLNIAIKNADLVDGLFGPGKNMGAPGHEGIETALVRLCEATHEERYLRLAQSFIDQRGNARGHELHGEFHENHRPLRDRAMRASLTTAGANLKSHRRFC